MRTTSLQCACDCVLKCAVKLELRLYSLCRVFVLGLDQVTSSASSSQNFKLYYCHI